MTTKISKKNDTKYSCIICDFNTCKKTDYQRHIQTQKHKNNTLTTNDNIKNEKIYMCDICDKGFNDRAGLWRHNKKCKVDDEIENITTEDLKGTDVNSFAKIPDEISDKELIIMLIKENSEFKNMMMEQSNMMLKVIENGTHNTNSHNNYSNNKSFNLHFFLNETCKDAMNIMDFVNSIQLQLSDLESVGKLGYVEGISNIITTNLKALDVTQRPVHCTDKKRETIYVKDENKWEKEDDQKNKIRKAIKRVATKNMCLLPKFKEAHPDCIKASSKYSDQYNKIIVESCGGSGENDVEKEDKIIRNISRMVTIDKE